MADSKVLILGQWKRGVKDKLEEILSRVSLPPVTISSWRSAGEWLRKPGIVAAIFPWDLPELESLCLTVRSQLSAEDLPLLAVTPCHWENDLERLFMFSADDFMAETNLDALEGKLLALRRGNPWTNLNPESGRVVVADPSRSRRIFYGRLLRRKGLGVEFAVDTNEVLNLLAGHEDVRLVIAPADLPPDGAADGMAACRARCGENVQIPWVICGGPEQLAPFDQEGTPDQPIRLLSYREPPESLLFLINDLLSPPPENARRSPRVLYGAPATFRILGSRHHVPAFTYNINRTGLFVRTLVPPPRKAEISVELRPPHGEGRVKVYGTVVWRKECTQEGGPVVPPGMGLIFSQVPLADHAGYLAGYEALVAARPSDGPPKGEAAVAEQD